jgi:hypothetical protein
MTPCHQKERLPELFKKRAAGRYFHCLAFDAETRSDAPSISAQATELATAAARPVQPPPLLLLLRHQSPLSLRSCNNLCYENPN